MSSWLSRWIWMKHTDRAHHLWVCLFDRRQTPAYIIRVSGASIWRLMSATPADRRLIQRSNCKADRLFFQLGRAFVSVQLSLPQVSCGRDPFLGVVPFCRRVLFRSCIPGSSVICRCPFNVPNRVLAVDSYGWSCYCPKPKLAHAYNSSVLYNSSSYFGLSGMSSSLNTWVSQQTSFQ